MKSDDNLVRTILVTSRKLESTVQGWAGIAAGFIYIEGFLVIQK